MSSKAVGLRTKSLQAEKGMRQADLAKCLGIKPTTVSKIEVGENMPTSTILVELHRIFSVSIDWVFTGEGPRAITVCGEHEEEVRELLEDIIQVPALLHSQLGSYYAFMAEYPILFEKPDDKSNGKGRKATAMDIKKILDEMKDLFHVLDVSGLLLLDYGEVDAALTEGAESSERFEKLKPLVSYMLKFFAP